MALTKSLLTTAEEYKTTLGESADEVICCPVTEKVTFAEIRPDLSIKEYVEPTISFSKWNKEETLSIIYPDTLFSDKTLVDGEVRMTADKEGFYFRQHDTDTLKFGLILNETPKNTQVWMFKLKNWENYRFEKQLLLQDDIDAGRVILKNPQRIGGYSVRHKTKKGNQYTTGKFGNIDCPRLIDADNNFLGLVDLNIKDGDYILSIENIPQKVLDIAKLPLKFNDTFGVTSVDGTYNTVLLEGRAFFGVYPDTTSAGTLSELHAFLTNGGASAVNLKMALYSERSEPVQAKPNLLLDAADTRSLAVGIEADISCTGGLEYSIQDATNYIIGIHVDEDNSSAVTCDADYMGNNGNYCTRTYADFPSSDESATSCSNMNVELSMYGVYTAGGSKKCWGDILVYA